MNRREGFYLIRLFNDYGSACQDSGYQCAEAQAFEGDDIAYQCRKKEAQAERKATRLQQTFAAKISEIVKRDAP